MAFSGRAAFGFPRFHLGCPRAARAGLSGPPSPLLCDIGSMKGTVGGDLSSITTLKRLEVRRTAITANGWDELKKELPNCNVLWQAK